MVVKTVSNITVSTEKRSLTSADDKYFSSSQENKYPRDRRKINMWIYFFKLMVFLQITAIYFA
jgi:hypothetical protein